MVYLIDIENKLVSTSSDRDITLFKYLNGLKHIIKTRPNDIESELIFKAFVEGDDGENTLRKLRKIRPFKGLHYTNNLILLIAAAKIDFKGEDDNIREYLSKYGYKEQLIINHAIGSEYRVANKIRGPVDSLAYLIEEGKEIKESDLQNCLSSIKDLYDLFVIEKGFARSIIQKNEEKNIPSYNILVKEQRKALKRIEFLSLLILSILFAYVLYLVIPSFISVVIKHWNTLEPIAYIVDKVVYIIILITGWVIATKVIYIKERIKKFILTLIYKILGISYSSYQKLLKIIDLE